MHQGRGMLRVLVRRPARADCKCPFKLKLDLVLQLEEIYRVGYGMEYGNE